MMKNFLKVFLCSALGFAAISCSDDDTDAKYPVSSERFNQMTVEEQTFHAPTNLFRAVYLNDKELFEKELDTAYLDFRKTNSEGNTALALAIHLRRSDFIVPLIQKATFEDLMFANRGGRSFLSLVAEYNYENALDVIGQKFTSQVGPIQMAVGNFSSLDFPDEENKRAAHYVQTASFIDKLEWYWFYGVIDFNHPWDSFYNHRDFEGDTFLHEAAHYDKNELLTWFVQRRCGYTPLENEGNWLIVQAVGFLFRKGTEYVQDIELPIFMKKIINVQNDSGNTALHLAAKRGNVRAVEILLQCAQIDPSMRNWDGQFVVGYLLKNLDPQQPVIPENYKKTFDLLVDLVDPLWSFLPNMTFKNLMNERDHDGFSAIHYAARLKDPYFYNVLRAYEISTPDGQGLLPQDRHR